MCYYYEIHYVLAFFFIYIFIADNISISMYIMCVVLCLFGALQICVIIIINNKKIRERTESRETVETAWTHACGENNRHMHSEVQSNTDPFPHTGR